MTQRLGKVLPVQACLLVVVLVPACLHACLPACACACLLARLPACLQTMTVSCVPAVLLTLLLDTCLSSCPPPAGPHAPVCSALRELCLSFYDVRATTVEVVSRLDVLTSPDSLPSYEQQVCALEALQMYAPMGHALGLSAVAAQLEDRCFQVSAGLGWAGLGWAGPARHNALLAMVPWSTLGQFEM
jgi:hypothetical protein